VANQSSRPLSTGKLGEYILYYLFYPAYIFDLLKLIGEKLRTVGIIIRAASFIIIPFQPKILSYNNNIGGIEYSTSNNSTSNNIQPTINTNNMGRKKQVQQSACDDDFAIRIDWRYDRPNNKEVDSDLPFPNWINLFCWRIFQIFGMKKDGCGNDSKTNTTKLEDEDDDLYSSSNSMDTVLYLIPSSTIVAAKQQHQQQQQQQADDSSNWEYYYDHALIEQGTTLSTS